MERVGIYNRCSTEEESQRSALAAQAEESREIAGKQGWEITEQYIESETGTVASRRAGYQRLLRDMEQDKFDIVMIKSIDRLTRSARDWYIFLGRLTANRLRLYIYIERKFYTPDDNLISGIKAILAEDFSRELSKKIRNAHRRRQEKKSGCNITCEMFGWNRIARDVYELNEREADYYRMAFSLAAEGKGFYTISNILYERGARGRKGQKISEVQWRKMLYAPRAHGTMVLNKRVYNFDTKKYEETPEKDWIMVENALPPVVSKEYQEEIIALLKKRAAVCRPGGRMAAPGSEEKEGKGAKEGGTGEKETKEKRRESGGKEELLGVPGGKYELSRKLVCGLCGKFYYRTGGKGKKEEDAVWKCSTFLAGGRSRGGENQRGCDNKNLVQSRIYDALGEIFRERYPSLYEKRGELEGEFLTLVKRALGDAEERGELSYLEKERKRLEARRKLLIEKLLDGVLEDGDYRKCHKEIMDRQRLLEEKMEGIKSRTGKYNSYETRMEKIREMVGEEGLIERSVTACLLRRTDRIVVGGDGKLSVFPEKFPKYL